MSEAPKEIWAYPSNIVGWKAGAACNRPINGSTHYTRTDAITPQMAAKVLRCPDGFNALVDAFEAAEGDTAARMDEALKAVARADQSCGGE